MHPANLSVMLTDAIKAATHSLDLATQNAAHEIVAIEGAYGLEGLFRIISHNVCDFLMVAAPAFDKQLKRATGRTRDQWLDLLEKEADYKPLIA